MEKQDQPLYRKYSETINKLLFMKNLAKKLENRIVVRLFAFMGAGAGISAAVAGLLTGVPEYREFISVPTVENDVVLSVSGWILLLLPLLMYLSVPEERKKLSLAAVLLIFGLFCGLIGAALSSVSIVFIKADIARGLLISAGMFFAMSLTGAIFRKDMISWHCILLTGVWGAVFTALGCWFFPQSATDWGVCMVSVIAYCAVMAYSGEEIQQIIAASDSERQWLNQLAALGALAVYLNFTGLLVKMLRFWESRGKCK